MAPEKFSGLAEEYNNKSNIWSIGIIIWQILSAEIPYDDDENYLENIANQSKYLYTKIPNNLDRQIALMLKEMLQFKPETRANLDYLLNKYCL